MRDRGHMASGMRGLRYIEEATARDQNVKDLFEREIACHTAERSLSAAQRHPGSLSPALAPERAGARCMAMRLHGVGRGRTCGWGT